MKLNKALAATAEEFFFWKRNSVSPRTTTSGTRSSFELLLGARRWYEGRIST